MPARVVPVTAVLVAHDGSRWLPEVLSALADSTVRPCSVVAVDTGSTDSSADLLRRALGRVLELPRGTTYPAAVAAGLRDAPREAYVWLLHDDSAPDRDALEQLLRAAAGCPTAGVLGPRVVDWTDPRVLVELGVSIDGAGRTTRGVEPGELDQGQYGGVRDVLAVGTAGALVRRETWDAAGGLDAELPLRDDLDLGWRVRAAGGRVVVVTQARVRHARALTTGERPLAGAPGSTARADRAAALRVLLTSRAGPGALLALPRLLLGSLLTSLLLLLGRRPGEAGDELLALLQVLGRPGRLLSERRARARATVVPAQELRPYFPPPGARLRGAVAALLDRSSGTAAVPTVRDAPAEPQVSALRRLVAHPGARLTAVLLLVALVAARALLGGGVLSGGRLLPAAPGAGDLWSAWAAAQDRPDLAVLAALATLLLGSASAAADLVLLGSVPLAGAVAWSVLGRLVQGRLLHGWVAATWALLPVATGAVAAGRIGAALVHVALPALLLAGWDLLSGGPRVRSHRAWALGLALTAVAAVQSHAWVLLAVLLLVAAAARGWSTPAARRRLTLCALAALLPAALLLPWAPGLLADLHGPGRVTTGLADGALPAWHLLLLQPGGPGTSALLLTAPLVLAALAGLLPDSRPRLAAAGWGLALAGLAAAVVLSRSRSGGEPVWPGVPADLVAAGLLLAVVAGADGLRVRLARTAFGWRQLAAVAVVVVAAAVPVVSALDWVRRGADGPLQRVERGLLPAYLQAELTADPGARALVLAPRPDGSFGYAVTGPDGPRLDESTDPVDELAGPVAALLTATPSTAAQQLADSGVRVVVLPEGSAPALDGQPGLAREPGERPAVWRVLPEGSPAPGRPGPDRAGVALQSLLVLTAAVLASPGLRPRRGLLREPRR